MIYVERIMWAIATIFLLSTGMYFTFKLHFAQFRLSHLFKSMKNDSKKGITPFKSLAMTLGARIGVGSLAGIALSIYYGGVGSIFWIWISTLICSTNAFAESILGVLYRRVDKNNGNYIGGPSYYIEDGMHNKKLGKVYAIILILAYIVGFLTVQSNTMVKSITQIYSLSPIIVSLAIVVLTILIIVKGLNAIANFSSTLVPFMTIGYTLVCTYIIILNIGEIPSIFKDILCNAFHPSSMFFGFITPLIIGFQRGTFSNEAGLGTGAIVSATANTNSPVKQGFVQVFGIYIETLILCTITTIVIMLSNYNNISWENINGIEITQSSFVYQLGNIGNYVVMISILLFAFSTIITGYYYGESNLKFIFKNIKEPFIFIFKIIVLIILFIGGIASPRLIWFIADIFVVIMGIINAYSLFYLRKDVIKEYKIYNKEKK